MAHAPTATLSRRHRAIATELANRNLEALVVTALPNILYLTNFAGSSAIVVADRERLQFITDFRYVTAISEMRGTPHECPALEVVKVDGSYDAALATVLAERSGAVGFEAAHLTVSRHNWLTSTLAQSQRAPALVATEGIVERARLRKDAYELAVLREGARRLSDVARGVFSEVRAGRTEREIAQAIDGRILAGGFSRPAFDTIVAAGPNAALPHAHPGERKLVESDLVVLDFGGVYDSYCVDLTRTVTVGRATERAREVYAAVLDAHDRAIATVGPGRSRFAIDRRRATRSPPGGSPRRSAMERVTVWESRFMKTPASLGRSRATRAMPAPTTRYRREWSSRSSPAPTSRAGAVCASKTMCS